MRFAIRDDDTNFFTDPEELFSAYHGVWDICPPTLSIISRVKGNWKYWVKEMYTNRQQMDWEAWRRDDQVSPISSNVHLIKFIKEKMKDRELDISFHAIHHRNEDPILPDQRVNNYIHGAEFFTTRNLSDNLRKELEYLNVTFDSKISVFTPPQNLLSAMGYKAVIENGLSIVGAGIAFWKKELTLNGIRNMTDVLQFKIRYPRMDYPFVLHFKNHSEAPHHYPLHPNTHTEDLIEKFDTVRRFNGDFVLSTHYHEFETQTTYNPSMKMKDVFATFMKYVLEAPSVQFCSVSNLLSTPH